MASQVSSLVAAGLGAYRRYSEVRLFRCQDSGPLAEELGNSIPW